MRGSTRKRGSTWTALWDGPVDIETGKRQQKSKGGFTTRKDAQRFLATVITATAEGTYAEPSKQPLGRFLLDEWVPSIGATVRPGTRARYAWICDRYIARRDLGAVPLRALTAGHLNGLYADMEREGLSVATRRLTHAVLRRALNDAVRWGKLVRNPAQSADPPAQPRSRVQSWSERELRQFLAHVATDRLFALWRLGATTGMRRGELLAPTWQSLDLEGARLRVDRQLVDLRGGYAYGPPKSKRSERTIALDPETVAALRRHRETQRLERDLAGPAYADEDLVFCNELGQPIHPQTLSDAFSRKRKAAGIPVGSLHVLRHTAATLMLTHGIPLHVAAARLGDDPTTVLSTYAHLLPQSDEKAAAAVAAIVDKPLTNAAEPVMEAAV